MKNYFLAALFVAASVIASQPAWASSLTAETMRIGQAYGSNSWESVESIHFTFNVRKGTTTVQRKWEWDVKTQQVTLETDEKGVASRVVYTRTAMDMGDEALNKKVDQWFVNDEYWLLFPLHLVWDNDAEITLQGEEALPIGKGRTSVLTVSYPAQGGYTPGDMYHIYYGPITGQDATLRKPSESKRFMDSPFVFRQWAFHRGGAAKPTLVATWEGYQRLGPLVIATEHRDKAGAFHLWFTDLKLKQVNDAEWKYPAPVDPPAK